MLPLLLRAGLVLGYPLKYAAKVLPLLHGFLALPPEVILVDALCAKIAQQQIRAVVVLHQLVLLLGKRTGR